MALENQENAGTMIPGEVAPGTNENNTDSTGDNNQETSSIEDRAREQGWKPKEEYEGDPSKWVSAETFVAKGELIDRIEALGKKLKDSEKTINLLKEHHARVKESEFKNAVAFLKARILAKPMIMPCSVNDCVKPDLESIIPIAAKLPWGVAEPLIAEAEVCHASARAFIADASFNSAADLA